MTLIWNLSLVCVYFLTPSFPYKYNWTISYLLLLIRSIILRVIKLLFSRGLGPFPLSFHPLSSQPWTQGDHQIKKIKWNTKSKSNHVFKISPLSSQPWPQGSVSLSFMFCNHPPPTPPKHFQSFHQKHLRKDCRWWVFFTLSERVLVNWSAHNHGPQPLPRLVHHYYI